MLTAGNYYFVAYAQAPLPNQDLNNLNKPPVSETGSYCFCQIQIFQKGLCKKLC